MAAESNGWQSSHNIRSSVTKASKPTVPERPLIWMLDVATENKVFCTKFLQLKVK